MRSNGRIRLAPPGPNPVAIPDAILAQVRRAGQSGIASAYPETLGEPGGEYAFLAAVGVDRAAVAVAAAEAVRLDVMPHEVMLSVGAMGPEAYAAALARQLGVLHAGWNASFDLEVVEDADDASGLGLPAHIGAVSCRVLCAEDGTPDRMRERIEALKARGETVALASRHRLEAVLEELWKAERIDVAVRGLFRQQPARSAAGPIWTWQLVAAGIAVDDRRLLRRSQPDARRADGGYRTTLSVRDVAATGGPARGRGALAQGCTKAGGYSKSQRPAAARLFGARAPVPGDKGIGRPGAVFAGAQLPQGQAGNPARSRGRRPGDAGGSAEIGPAQLLPHHLRA